MLIFSHLIQCFMYTKNPNTASCQVELNMIVFIILFCFEFIRNYIKNNNKKINGIILRPLGLS